MSVDSPRPTDRRDPAATPDDPRRWLAAAAVPGRRSLRLVAVSRVAETSFLVIQWSGLAAIAQGALLDRTSPSLMEVGLLLGGGMLAAGSAAVAGRFQAEGRNQIADTLRDRLVRSLLPSGRRRERDGPAEHGDRADRADPATATLATVELVDDIADHHAAVRPQRLAAPASMAIVLVVTAAVHWPSALILLLATLLVPLNMRLTGAFAKEGADERAAAMTHLAAVVLDSFRGIRTLRGLGAIERRRSELAGAAAELNVATLAILGRAFLSGAVMDVVITFSIAANATYVGLALLGYVRIAIVPAVTLWSGLFVLLLCPMYFQPLRAWAASYHSRERALSAVPTIAGLVLAEVDEAAEEEDVPAGPRLNPAFAGVIVTPPGPVEVVLDRVSFEYPGSPPVLHDVDLKIRGGSWTAIVGPSGAGKTTLLSLIAGLRRPTAGSVRWIIPTGSAEADLGRCSWIGQGTVLLPGTIGDNIRIGRPSATSHDLAGAVAAAGLSDVLARLPSGLDTELGDGGAGISTGEARRIAIARAFLRDAELWVLDEPTAHLDPDAEARVVEALREATRGRTIVVATHSAAVARSADRVLVLADGTIRHPQEAIAA
jgi:ATP-binding cassette, subfamily C, bacterial CydD